MTERPRGSGRITSNCSKLFDPQGGWGLVTALAAGQQGVITTAQLLASGLSHATIHRYTEIGWLHRIHRGVYALTPIALLPPYGRRMAAVLACGPRAALSHEAAGDHIGLIASAKTRWDVTVPTRGGRAREGIQMHRSATLRRCDVTAIAGVPCTTVARTIFDLADALRSPRRVERALDQAVALGCFDLEALDEQIAHNAGRCRAARLLSRVLSDHRPGSTPTWNEIEELLLASSRRIGLPDPEVQQWLDLGDGEPMIRPDFIWRESRLIVETDGWKHHGTRGSFESDRRRDQRALVAGWSTLRVTWRQLTGERDRFEATLLAVASRGPAAIAA
jgi:hypothetical protein